MQTCLTDGSYAGAYLTVTHLPETGTIYIQMLSAGCRSYRSYTSQWYICRTPERHDSSQQIT